MNIKNIIIVFLFCSFISHAKTIKVKGKIDQYSPSEKIVVVANIFKDWKPLFLDEVYVDKDGYFDFEIADYSGMMQIKFYRAPVQQQRPPIFNTPIVINGKEDIEFIVYANQPMKIVKDEENKFFNKKIMEQNQIIIKIQQIEHQITNYDREDEFYNSLNTQKKRLLKQLDGLKDSLDYDKFPFASLYVFLQSNLYNKVLTVGSQSNPKELNDIKKSLVDIMDVKNKKMTNSNFISDIFNYYFNINKLIFPNDNKKIENEIKKDIDYLFSNNMNIKTSEGQMAFQFMLDMFRDMGKDRVVDYLIKKIDAVEDCDVSGYLKDRIEKQKKTIMGSKVPEITFTKPLKDEIKKLSDIKAKKKIIVFWASWCSHCQKEIPKLIPIYDQLKSKDIEILAISLDDEESRYKEAIKNFKWLNYCDYGRWKSQPALDYNIYSTPSFLLVDDNMVLEYRFDNIYEIKDYFKLKSS